MNWHDVAGELLQVRGSALKRYGYLLCGNRVEADDLVQDALVRVFAQPRRSWDIESAERYVRRVMLNRYLDQHRRRARWRILLPRLVSPTSTGDFSVASGDRMDIVSALDSLSPRQRACTVLRFYEDLSVAEVADRLGCSPGTVKRHLSEAIARLGNILVLTSLGGERHGD
ncbi:MULTISPECIES: SigE family RNA polymerase sigma factor [Streptomyces]|uniref:SigE family RNA polymerase sigma factor n=1 Tax=Streptomyces virginiae TaxID=1961 RepID=A0ABZ1T703_STRVG|nr:SigE family RNA polymerase sigma factor [Streptomyces virginiae]WTB20195.1 SigE family RNA polymerase sigma factor [Streptomyces virginiae]